RDLYPLPSPSHLSCALASTATTHIYTLSLHDALPILTENLAFYWAHARLAGVDLALHDTAAALTELGLAVEIEPNDPALRLYNGYVLGLARRYTEAVAELDVAIRLDPYYAQPHVQLA